MVRILIYTKSYISSDVLRARIANAFPSIVNEVVGTDPISLLNSKMLQDGSGLIQVEINKAGFPNVSNAQKTAFKNHIQSWNEFVRFDVSSA